MNIELKDLSSKLQTLLRLIKPYVTFMFFIGALLIAGFLVFRINQLSNVEPSDDAVTEKLQTVQRLRLDPETLEKIEQLQSENIEVQSLFDQARDNPFSE